MRASRACPTCVDRPSLWRSRISGAPLHFVSRCTASGTHGKRARPSRARANFTARDRSVETTGRVGEHGVDLARLRGQVRARQHLVAVLARDLLEQPLELADIAIDGAAEIAVGAIALADFLERLLALHGVKLAREHVAFAALVAIPQLGCRVVVDHAGDVDRKRIERLEAVTLGARALVGSAARRDRKSTRL